MEFSITDLKNIREGLYFERKSARVEPKDIIRHVIAFANANGGTLAIGIENDGELTGFSLSSHLPEEYKAAILKGCIPVPTHSVQHISYGHSEGEFVLLITVNFSTNQVIRTQNEKVYLRVSDSSVELTHSQITALEYDKGQRAFEDQIVADSTMDDLDLELLAEYQKILKTDKSFNDILRVRGLMRNDKLTNAAILLFGKQPTQFLPGARIRFIRYEGKNAGVGGKINIIKERTFDEPIPKAIEKIAPLIRTQLRDFQMLTKTGKFEIVPEYPEFTWLEGIVNALTHRDYSIYGEHIRVSMFDDRLEIFSPGKLPNVVTLENMKYTRFSRNPRISRVLSDFGWVKELNEGVNRIYDEMQGFYLRDPEYSEPNGNAVLLTLGNSIASRHLRAEDKLSQKFYQNLWQDLDDNEKRIVHFVYVKNRITSKEVANLLGRSTVFARKVLKGLAKKKVLVWHGSSKNDSKQYYTLIQN